MHSYVTSGSGGIQFYNTPGNCPAPSLPEPEANGILGSGLGAFGLGRPSWTLAFNAGLCQGSQTGRNVAPFFLDPAPLQTLQHMFFRQALC